MDTHPEAERVWIDLLRRQSPSQKLAQIFSFSQTIIQLSKNEIARANPDLDETQLKLLFIKYHYGDKLAAAVEECLQEKKYEKS